MKLSRYLEYEKSLPSSRKILTSNIGDKILYTNNRVFRNVRNSYLGLGFNFTNENIGHYFCSKFSALDHLRKKKLIPFLPNNLVLKRLEKSNPSLFNLSDVKKLKINFNPVNHECCHLIFDHHYRAVFLHSKTNRQQIYLSSHLEEAFTDCVEVFMLLERSTESERFAISFNAYFQSLSQKEIIALKNLKKEAGSLEVAKLVILLSLWAHFLNNKYERKTHDLIIEFLSFSRQGPLNYDYGNCKMIFTLMASAVAPIRIDIGDIYFRSRDRKMSIHQSSNFDPIAMLTKNPEKYHSFFERLRTVFC